MESRAHEPKKVTGSCVITLPDAPVGVYLVVSLARKIYLSRSRCASNASRKRESASLAFEASRTGNADWLNLSLSGRSFIGYLLLFVCFFFFFFSLHRVGSVSSIFLALLRVSLDPFISNFFGSQRYRFFWWRQRDRFREDGTDTDG